MAFRVIEEYAEHENFEGLCQMAVNEGFELQHMNSFLIPSSPGRVHMVKLIAIFF